MLKENLKDLRLDRMKSQKEISELFGVKQQTVGKWENGINVPSNKYIQKYCDQFNVTRDYLFRDSTVEQLKINENPEAKIEEIKTEETLATSIVKVIERLELEE